MTRRMLLARVVTVAGAAAAAVIGVPALLFSFSPARRQEGATWQALDRLDTFPVGGVRAAVVRRPASGWPRAFSEEAVFVWRRAADDVVVFSRTCTDLGCPVEWDAGSEWFFCPCHGGVFAKDGAPMAGPPPRPLYRYATRIRAGRVEVDVNSLPPQA